MMTSQLPTTSPAISPTSTPAMGANMPPGADGKYGDLAVKAVQASEEIDKAATAAQQQQQQPAAAASRPKKKLTPTTVKGAAASIGQWTAACDLKLYYGNKSFELHISTERKLVTKFDTIGALSFDQASGLLRLRLSSPPLLSLRTRRKYQNKKSPGEWVKDTDVGTCLGNYPDLPPAGVDFTGGEIQRCALIELTLPTPKDRKCIAEKLFVAHPHLQTLNEKPWVDSLGGYSAQALAKRFVRADKYPKQAPKRKAAGAAGQSQAKKPASRPAGAGAGAAGLSSGILAAIPDEMLMAMIMAAAMSGDLAGGMLLKAEFTNRMSAAAATRGGAAAAAADPTEDPSNEQYIAPCCTTARFDYDASPAGMTQYRYVSCGL